MKDLIYFDANGNYPTIQYNCNKAIACHNISANPTTESESLINDIKKKIRELHGDYQVIFTSGGSESNSTAINHVIYNNYFIKKVDKIHFVCSSVEHPSITNFVRKLEKDSIIEVTWIKPAYDGFIDITTYIDAIKDNTALLIMQSCNSETGVIQDIGRINIEAKKRNIPMFVDNVQGFMKIDYPRDVGDMISISFHKIGGPIGSGALLIRKNHVIHPLIHGKQNDGLRGGTYNYPALCCTWSAMKSFKKSSNSNYLYLKLINDLNGISYNEFVDRVNKGEQLKGPYCVIMRDKTRIYLNHTFLIFCCYGMKILCGGKLKQYLLKHNILIGTGSACNSGKSATVNMNEEEIFDYNLGSIRSVLDARVATGIVRISLHDNSKKEINLLLKNINMFISENH